MNIEHACVNKLEMTYIIEVTIPSFSSFLTNKWAYDITLRMLDSISVLPCAIYRVLSIELKLMRDLPFSGIPVTTP